MINIIIVNYILYYQILIVQKKLHNKLKRGYQALLEIKIFLISTLLSH